MERIFGKERAATPLAPPKSRQPLSEEQSARKASLLELVEQPLVLCGVGLVAGIVGLFIYWPVLILSDLCILLGVHRARIFAGKPDKLQVTAYVGIAAVLLLVSCGLGIMIQDSQEQINAHMADLISKQIKKDSQSMNNDEVLGFVQFESISGILTIAAGSPIKLNAYWTNKSNHRTFNFYVEWGMTIRKTPQEPNEAAHFRDEYLESVKAELVKAPKSTGDVVGLREGRWRTLRSPPLTQDEADGLATGRYSLFIVSYAHWESRSGTPDEANYCGFTVGPLRSGMSARRLGWHLCALF